jgi:epoxyqueuosine reductase
MNSASAETQIMAEAARLGFAAAGIAEAGPAQSIAVFRKWVAEGRAAGMDYLSRHDAIRADTRRLEPWARSIVVVAARYPVNERPGFGFSTYAGGLDYHIALRAKLLDLAARVRQLFPAAQARACVDSTPLLERELAIRAGIGWRGKQSQVVNAKMGCCLFLGELLLDIGLSSSQPVPNRCGRCRLCVDACPTGAIGEDGLIDARKCISYLTIEHKAAIPEHLQALLGEAVFGCDLCTAVCPWNRFGADCVMPEFRGQDMPDAAAIRALDRVRFRERFRHTAAYRTGLQRLQRNAAIALRNAGAANS